MDESAKGPSREMPGLGHVHADTPSYTQASNGRVVASIPSHFGIVPRVRSSAVPSIGMRRVQNRVQWHSRWITPISQPAAGTTERLPYALSIVPARCSLVDRNVVQWPQSQSQAQIILQRWRSIPHLPTRRSQPNCHAAIESIQHLSKRASSLPLAGSM